MTLDNVKAFDIVGTSNDELEQLASAVTKLLTIISVSSSIMSPTMADSSLTFQRIFTKVQSTLPQCIENVDALPVTTIFSTKIR